MKIWQPTAAVLLVATSAAEATAEAEQTPRLNCPICLQLIPRLARHREVSDQAVDLAGMVLHQAAGGGRWLHDLSEAYEIDREMLQDLRDSWDRLETAVSAACRPHL